MNISKATDFFLGVPGVRRNREHNLFYATSKHLYLTKEGRIKYQKTPLDPRTCGTKTLLDHLVLLDLDTGAVYAETLPVGNSDLFGFLMRAWATKKDSPFRGIPEQLNVPKRCMTEPTMKAEIDMIADRFSIRLEALPGGFKGGIHAVRNYESALTYPERTLYAAMRTCSMASAGSAPSGAFAWDMADKQGGSLRLLTAADIAWADAKYEIPGDWRTDPYDFIVPEEAAVTVAKRRSRAPTAGGPSMG